MKPQTILYIEDDDASRRLIERMLSHAGYHVLLAERGIDGIDIARKERPDLILTDINLPDLSGYEITTSLRSDPNFAQTPIVALTAQGPTAHATAVAAGITGFLTKPIDIEKFIDQLRYYLDGGRDSVIDEHLLHDAQVRYTRDVVARLEKRIRDLEGANASLLRLDKMKQTFIQVVAHELRTPLTLLFGYGRLLEDHADIKGVIARDETAGMLFEGLIESITRMQNMIDEILTMSRIMTNQIDLSISPVNLGQIVQSALNQFQDAIRERRLTVKFDITQFPARMQADNNLIKIVVANLISNAIKYTPDQGTITITATTTTTHTQLAVRDTGVGVHMDEHLKIFEQFHTPGNTELHSTSKTAFMGGGLGLGLPIVRGIVQAHGGKVWVESPGHDPMNCPGSLFVVSIPLVVQRDKTTKTETGTK